MVVKPHIKNYWWVDLRGHDFGGIDLDHASIIGCILDGADFRGCSLVGATIAYCAVLSANNPPLLDSAALGILHLAYNNFEYSGCQEIQVDLNLANTARYLIEDLPRDGVRPDYPDLLRPYLGKVPHPSLLAPLVQLCLTDHWLLYMNAFVWSKVLLLEMLKQADDYSIPAAVLMFRFYTHLGLYHEVRDILIATVVGGDQHDRDFGAERERYDGFEEFRAKWLRAFQFACQYPWVQGSKESSWLFSFIEETRRLFHDLLAASPSPFRNWLSKPEELSLANWRDLLHLYLKITWGWVRTEAEEATLFEAFKEALSFLLRSTNEELVLLGLRLMDGGTTFFYHEGNALLPGIGENASLQEVRDLAYWIMFRSEYPNEKRLGWLRAGKLSEAHLAELAEYDYFWKDENSNPLMPIEDILHLLQSEDAEQVKEGLWWASIFPFPTLRAQLEQLAGLPDLASASMVGKAISRIEAFKGDR
jgi:hypothetical protein